MSFYNPRCTPDDLTEFLIVYTTNIENNNYKNNNPKVYLMGSNPTEPLFIEYLRIIWIVFVRSLEFFRLRIAVDLIN
jgi:hypothetical protein